MSEQENSKPRWHKALSSVGSAIFIIAVIAWNWNAIKANLFSDDMAIIEKTTSELMEESLAKNEDLKKFARVCEVKEVTLVKEGSGNNYKGTATVVMQARTKDSTDEHIKYGGNPITVSYSLKVIYDGRNVMLNNAEMEDADLAKLLKAAGVSDDDEKADESDNDNSVTSADESPANDGEPPLDGVEFVKKRKSLTKLQRKRLVDGAIGRIIEFRDCEVDDITDKSFLIKDYEKALLVTLYVPTCDYYVHATVTDPRMVASGENLEKGSKLKVLSGKLRKDEDEVFPFYVDNARFVKEKPEKTNTIKLDKSVAEKLLSMMEAQNKMTKEAVGWVRNPMSEEDQKALPAILAEMGESACTAMMEKLESENRRLKEFLDLGKIADAERKRQGQEPFLDEDTVKTFLISLDPDQQKELLEKMKANSKKSEYGSSQKTQITGADIVRECERKPNGYSSAQIDSLQKKLNGQMLTFEDGKVINVLKCSDDSAYDVHIVVRFKSFRVDAYFPKSDAARLIETVDEGAHIKSLTGRADSEKRWGLFTLTDAKIVLSEK